MSDAEYIFNFRRVDDFLDNINREGYFDFPNPNRNVSSHKALGFHFTFPSSSEGFSK